MTKDATPPPGQGAPRPRRRDPRCPVCGRPAVPEHRPFCSARCRQVDLGRWLTGGYAIPGGPDDAAEDEDEEGLTR